MNNKLNAPADSFSAKAKRALLWGGLLVGGAWLGLEFAPEAVHWAGEQLGAAGAEIALHTHQAIGGVLGPEIIHPAVA